ncbi:MAG: DegT/DnrJ/EryC1/StrS family aminotransferase [Caldilineales bacterium]|nr:DegT/DnrJ/EryC1/StrS family aminotransferase [Caldilineales bacterium]
MINVFQPSLGDEELEAVRKVFASNWVGRGARTTEFETAFAQHCQVPPNRMVSISCATEGLFQAVELLGIGPDDEVVLPSLSFVGAANAVMASGARPVFCDVDRRTLNPTATHIEARLSAKTRAVIVLHYGGAPCEMDDILSLVKHRGLHLIEDSACSVASRYKGQPCGTLGDIGIWSFDAMKILVTGDGGMVYCRDDELAERLRRKLYLGLEQSSGFSQAGRERWWEFEVGEVGRRAIMNNVTAAIGLVQLHRLPEFIARRRQVHQTYNSSLNGMPEIICPPNLDPNNESSYYFYWIQLEPSRRDALAKALLQRDIYTTFRYHPLHLVSRYQHDASAHLPESEWAAERTLCLPIHQSLSDEDVEKVIDGICWFLSA